jgi:hypothetical protein
MSALRSISQTEKCSVRLRHSTVWLKRENTRHGVSVRRQAGWWNRTTEEVAGVLDDLAGLIAEDLFSAGE